MAEEKQNNSNQQSSSNNSVQNDKNHNFSEGYAHDSHWITERGGTNNEPGDAPEERPHSSK